jgi:hypothetical protein
MESSIARIMAQYKGGPKLIEKNVLRDLIGRRPQHPLQPEVVHMSKATKETGSGADSEFETGASLWDFRETRFELISLNLLALERLKLKALVN